jgi:putative ABC transport system permease protein
MFKNDLLTAWRSIKRFKYYSFLKIAGLSLGFACGLVIFLYVQREFGFDKFHAKADRIFRMEMEMNLPGGKILMPLPWAKIGPALEGKFPAVERTSRMAGPAPRTIDYRDQRFRESMAFVEPAFFEIFTFPLLQGDSKTALRDPFSIVLTKELADKILPGEEPLGRVLRIDGKHDFRITGVLRPVPAASHLQFGLLASYDSQKTMGGEPMLAATYVLLRNGSAAGSLERSFKAADKKGWVPATAVNDRFFFRPLTSIHLHGDEAPEAGGSARAKAPIYLALLGAFILGLAAINVLNLATANAVKRMKEVGIRKSIGAGRGRVIRQFLVEALMISGLASLGAVLLTSLILPLFNGFSRGNLSVDLWNNSALALCLLAFVFFVGLFSGFYPAWLISALPVTDTVKGRLGRKFAKARLRRIMVVFQFSICILFIVGATTSVRQLRSVAQRNLGYDKAGLLILPAWQEGPVESFKNDLLQIPDVVAVSLNPLIPVGDFKTRNFTVTPEGHANPGLVFQYPVDARYFRTMGIPIVEGRDFNEEAGEGRRSVIINEQAAHEFGWTSAVGKHLRMSIDSAKDIQDVTVVGVVRDFHIQSLRKAISPAVFLLSEEPDQVLARIKTKNLTATLAAIKSAWLKHNPASWFEAQFLDDKLASQYDGETRTKQILIFASILAILVSGLGLLGLASFTAESRTKEIGIRKVLGALPHSIVKLLSREIVLCVLAASLIAWPAAFLMMKSWLRSFAYPIPLRAGLFIFSSLGALLIALLTVGYTTIRAALANPVESLKNE